ncbi:LysR family transcriptional regulator [Paraburkholderia elongata]|uniref:LysR family transcriptional regulator n=1 Tax=Paraburkholderia elongata TaxID=2675747 RepID=A0A972SMN7_9BURK|nr:LysR family transcriptional regulator [Paraburkholderia elongata]NPT60372.1 LysR family transcriptional regulator [Paraburkholderia elongata]
MKLDLNLLRVLVAVYETRNITSAATLLSVSQPAASAALARLRDAFNDPLFVRTPGGMEPTPRTLSIIEKVKEVLTSIDQDILSSQTFEPLHATDEFVLCMTAIAEYVFLPHLVSVTNQRAPLIRMRSLSLAPQDLQESLLNGKVNLAIGFYPDLVSADIYQQRLFSHRLVCLVRQGHAIAGDRMTLDAFVNAGHVDVRDGSRTSEMFEESLSNKKIQRNIVLTTSHYMSIPRILAESDLIAVAPLIVARIFAQQFGLRVMSLPLELPDYDLKQYWHRKYHHEPKLVWLRTLIQSEFSDAYVAGLLRKLGTDYSEMGD